MRRLAASVVVVLFALVFVPLSAAHTDRASRALACNSQFMPSCTINFTLVQESVGSRAADNAPTIGGYAKWRMTPASVGDGCSTLNFIAGIVGPNSGVSVNHGTETIGGVVYQTLSYIGAFSGIDRVQIHASISGCNGWVYTAKINGSTDPFQTHVSWGNNARDNGGCDAIKAAARLKGIQYSKTYYEQCIDDPVGEGLGSYETAVTDATLAAPGIPFAFRRTYNSDDSRSGILGFGWRSPYDSYLVINTSVTPNTVTANMGDGEQILFTKQTGGSWLGPAWTTAQLTLSGSVYTLTLADRSQWRFGASNGALSGILDRNGQQLTVSSGTAQPFSVTTSNGKQITFSYTTGRLTTLTLPGGRTVQYGYSSAGDLTSVTDLRGGVTHYTYDTNHHLLTIVDARGNTVLTNTYGDYGRLTSQKDALNHTTTYSFQPESCVSTDPSCAPVSTNTATDARNHAWKDQFTADGLLASQTDPLGNISSYTSDATTGDPLTRTDPLGNAVQFQYDSHHNLTQTTLPGAITTSATFTANSDLSTATDGRGYTTTYGYDTNGNPTLITYPDTTTTSYTYNTRGEVATATDQAGKTTTYDYDTNGYLTSKTTPLGNKWTYGYDTSGRMTSIVDPRGNVTGANPADYTTTIAYDNADNITSITDPLGHATNYTYDADGNLSGIKDPNNHTTSYTYDANNRLTTATAPDLTTTSYGYDEVGNLISRTDANGHTTNYTYDADNRLITVTDPLSRQWTLGYDADSNLTTITTPSGGTITYSYDALGRRTGTSYSDSTPSIVDTLDADGNASSMTDGGGTSSYTYDHLDRLTQVTEGTDTTSYTYDPVGRIASRTYPDGTVTSYTYNDDGELATATTSGEHHHLQLRPRRQTHPSRASGRRHRNGHL